MTDIEQRLIRAARDGEWLECAEPGTVVRAGLIRELLMGRRGELDPGGVKLRGVRIEGTLDLVRVKAVAGLSFSDCTLDEPVMARYASLPELHFYGGSCAGIHANGLQLDGDLFLRGGIRITGDDPRGTIRLLDARIAGDVEFADVEITNTGGAALHADGLKAGGNLTLRGVRIAGSGRSALNLFGAHVAANFKVTESEVTNGAGAALVFDNITVGGNFSLRKGNRITGHGEEGAVRLVSAHISGHVEMRDTEIINAAGPALESNGIQVGGNLLLRDRLLLTGHDEFGAADLAGARIGNALQFAGATVTNTAGPALRADRARIGDSLIMIGANRFSAGGDGPALSLIGTHVDGRFGCADAVELSSGSNLVMNLQHMVVGVSTRLPHAALCPALGRGPACEHDGLVRIDDFSYPALGSGWDWEQWLHVIRCHTPAYHASAYQRLAAVERAAGHDGTVRRILMAQQTDLRRRSPQSLGGTLTRWFHWLWGVLAGYGYRARRTAAALLLVLVAAGAIGWWAGQVDTRPGHHVAERVTTPGVPCSTVELVGLGLDRGLPLAMTGMRTRCDLDTASQKGQAFTAAIWLVQLAVWGLATLALAGYTNLVRKPG
ncbi:hypothetical protein AB0E59_46065 [Lentzea sp. NPDC034063]|uniref:hypothetical protein n=1 Tax=unclassified Lentzea TaxID=2643253 RepID=UPI003400DDAA